MRQDSRGQRRRPSPPWLAVNLVHTHERETYEGTLDEDRRTPNCSPAGDFNNPSSFQQGIPILVSNYTQHVDVDTVTSSFVTAHLNDITATTPFWLNGTQYQLGQVGRSFRTHYLGHVNSPGLLPFGWVGGYAVGVDKKDN
jgi:hypothetical protein